MVAHKRRFSKKKDTQQAAAGSISARDLKLHFSLLLLVRRNKFLQISTRQFPSTEVLIFTHNLYMAVLVYIHELVVRARQLDSVTQLVRALHRRAGGSIPASDQAAFFTSVHG